ncbi:hypothetical protein P170DRAFT_480047 [Aspergillus steynii IBT 23096]|uniref:Zn(2)-C6 fungal-type domain-containing protein n=1 Tax=Aspergillus steynii IBT 23096 TaxID=1392250 RepID=A0A2I2FUI5_9EURO|nr:uncharacterized protein P170DRAFT_480047 [Aspergillus steynii IBT 23096]PLB44284.1 hypothetical protein P170DRAFT_480047 [Aspergillus steynii IBT 23096]
MVAADISRAPNVCANCKARKKRCDKSLPRCRYCADRNLACCYQTSSSSPRRPIADPVFVSSASSSPSTVWRGASVVPTSIPRLPFDSLAPEIEPGLCVQAQRLLETTGLYLDEISVRYFRGIHTFVPIVSRRRFQAHLLSFGVNPQADFALLLLCMGLLTYSADSPHPAPPGGGRVENRMLYVATKSLMAQAQALCQPSTQLVQAGVLLAVYEYANGNPETAFITIGSAARMAYAARLRSVSLLSTAPPRTDWTAEEEEINIWWGIRVCERTFLCELPIVEQPLGSVMPARDDRLPLESSVLDHGNPSAALASSVAIQDLSAPQVGGFGRAAQAAWLLDGVLQGLSLTDADRKRTHLADCDRTLQSLLAIVMQQMQQQGGNYGPFCVATALTIRALFLLHWHLLDQPTYESPGSDSPVNSSHSALDTVTQMVIDICITHEHMSISQIDQLPPSCLYIIRASMKHMQSPTPDPRLYASLKQFEARWGASSAFQT